MRYRFGRSESFQQPRTTQSSASSFPLRTRHRLKCHPNIFQGLQRHLRSDNPTTKITAREVRTLRPEPLLSLRYCCGITLLAISLLATACDSRVASSRTKTNIKANYRIGSQETPPVHYRPLSGDFMTSSSKDLGSHAVIAPHPIRGNQDQIGPKYPTYPQEPPVYSLFNPKGPEEMVGDDPNTWSSNVGKGGGGGKLDKKSAAEWGRAITWPIREVKSSSEFFFDSLSPAWGYMQQVPQVVLPRRSGFNLLRLQRSDRVKASVLLRSIDMDG